MSQNNIVQKNRVYAPVLVGVSLLIIALIVYPLYTKYVDASTVIHGLETTKSEKQSKIDEIKKMQQEFNSGATASELSQKVARYDHGFSSSDIMESLMLKSDTLMGSKFSPAKVQVNSVTVGKGTKLPSGLSLATVSVSLTADSIDSIVEYLTYLTLQSDLAFTIDTINLPLDTTPKTAENTSTVSLGVALGVYYYE